MPSLARAGDEVKQTATNLCGRAVAQRRRQQRSAATQDVACVEQAEATTDGAIEQRDSKAERWLGFVRIAGVRVRGGPPLGKVCGAWRRASARSGWQPPIPPAAQRGEHVGAAAGLGALEGGREHRARCVTFLLAAGFGRGLCDLGPCALDGPLSTVV